ncbi:MAG: S-layer protein, partial [Methanospirillum sp.]
LDYVLPDGTMRRQNESFAVLVRGRATLGLASLTTDPVQVEAGQAFTLLARLENTGTDDAKSVRVRIDLPFSGNNESFIGTVEPGNDAPAVFNLVADRTGSLAYTLSATYNDDEGTHTVTEPLTLEVAANNGSMVTIAAVAIVVVLLAAAGIWYWRRRSA